LAYRPTNASYYLGLNIGIDFRIIHSHSELRKLNIADCEYHFFNANKSVIFIDHEALPVFDDGSYYMQPTEKILEDIHELTLDKRNTVVIFSNKSKEALIQYFGHINDIWLAAESGYLYKTGSKSEWKKLILLAKRIWLNSVLEIMNSYAHNTDGAIVEQKESTIVYNYKNADEEQGNLVVKELYDQVKQTLANAPVEII